MAKRSFCDFCNAELSPSRWVDNGDVRVKEISAKAMGCVVRGHELVLQVHVQLGHQQMCENCFDEALNSAFPTGRHLHVVPVVKKEY